MKAKPFQILLQIIHFGFFAVFFVGCTNSTNLPTNTPHPTNSRTPTKTLQPSATFTVEQTSTTTPNPEQTSLSGIIFLTNPDKSAGSPWLTTYVELLHGDVDQFAEYPDENRPQIFTFKNIEPGNYQLWVLILPSTLYLKNCYDLGLPDETWKLGKIVGNKRVFMPSTKTYREVFLQADTEHQTNQKALEFYAVRESLEIKRGTDNYIDATFICKP